LLLPLTIAARATLLYSRMVQAGVAAFYGGSAKNAALFFLSENLGNDQLRCG